MKKQGLCTILGCGGSDGVPQICCSCQVCKSPKKKNKRTRPSIFISTEGINILIDTSPNLREQCITNNINKVDAILYTHAHADHISGLSDIKRFVQNYLGEKGGEYKIQIFCSQETGEILLKSYPYIFKGNNNNKIYHPISDLNIFEDDKSELIVHGVKIIMFKQDHCTCISHGFRIGDLAYSTDLSFLPTESYEKLKGIKTWILDIGSYYKTATHLDFNDVILLVAKIKPSRVVLTHMSHNIEYYEMLNLLRQLPFNIVPAYDSMQLSFEW